MNELRKIRKQSVDGADIHFSFFSDPDSSRPTIVTVPGGPGISNHYMHAFLSDLAKISGWNVALVDLPNHDESIVQPTLTPLTYDVCTQLLTHSLNALFGQFQGLVFLGQSLGSRIALDLLLSVELNVVKSILINCPSRFDVSQEFQRRLEEISLTPDEASLSNEAAFQGYWKKACPLNFYNTVSKEDLELLVSNTKWVGNEGLLDEVPSLEEISKKLRSANKGSDLTFIEGRQDPLLVEGNSETIQALFPHAGISFIDESGHFPMIENKNETLQAVLRELQAI